MNCTLMLIYGRARGYTQNYMQWFKNCEEFLNNLVLKSGVLYEMENVRA